MTEDFKNGLWKELELKTKSAYVMPTWKEKGTGRFKKKKKIIDRGGLMAKVLTSWPRVRWFKSWYHVIAFHCHGRRWHDRETHALWSWAKHIFKVMVFRLNPLISKYLRDVDYSYFCFEIVIICMFSGYTLAEHCVILPMHGWIKHKTFRVQIDKII